MATTRRLFFALWPNEALRAKLVDTTAAAIAPCHGKVIPQALYHITLAFLGDIPGDRLPCVAGLGDGIAGRAFRLALDTLGFFPKARVAWVGMSEVPSELTDLYGQLARGLPRCGLSPETRPYHPHITLVRKATCGPAATFSPPICWPVNDFALVESDPSAQGATYRVLQRWVLAGDLPEKGG